jgi:hypothetical protein
MPLTAKSILEQVARDLNDTTSIRWTTQDLARYFNDGQRYIITKRPDASHLVVSHPLVAGAEQSLPVGGEKLIDVSHNTTGNKRAISRVSSALLDAQLAGWRGAPGKVEILHFTYDEREPRSFDVYPPAAAGASVSLKYAAQTVDIPIPAAFTTTDDITGNFSLSDLFGNSQRNYVMFRCYSKQTELANPGLAAGFLQMCNADLGDEAGGTAAVSPKD